MEKQPDTLSFRWTGDAKGKDGQQIYFSFDGTTYGPYPYNDVCELEIPINAPLMEIKVEFSAGEGKRRGTSIKHTFPLEPGKSHQCRLSGQVSSFSGLGLQMSKGGEAVSDDTPLYRNDAPVAILSFAFPIYGIIKACSSAYNRTAAVAGAAIGFILSMILSACASGNTIALGFGRLSLFEYEPFSLTDIIVNLLIGGISSIRGFLDLFFS